MSTHANTRLEAFSDGVFAIALTLLIIELKTPAEEGLQSTADVWRALYELLPIVFAFLLSFVIILITWVNHHRILSLIDKSSSPFVYANGFMLLTIVVIPFPTAMLGEYLLSHYPSPAVVLYSGTCALQAVAWMVWTRTALSPAPLTKSERASMKVRKAHKDSFFAFGFYGVCTILAIWLPVPAAAMITASWIVWLVYSIRIKED